MFRLFGASGRIIQVLFEDFPLSTKEIHRRLQRNFGVTSTYQAVHKQLGELLNQGVVEKDGKNYKLSEEWIAEGKDIFSRVSEYYSSKTVSSLIPNGPVPVTHTFFSPLDLAKFVISFSSGFPNPGDKKIVFRWWSFYPTFSLSEKDYKKMREIIKKNKLYILVKCQTSVDLSLEKEYLQLGAKVKSGVDNPVNPDVLVNGDFVCFIYFPQKFRLDWEKYCRGSGGGKIVHFAKLLSHIFDTKTGFNIVVTKSPALAEQIRTECLLQFRRA